MSLELSDNEEQQLEKDFKELINDGVQNKFQYPKLAALLEAEATFKRLLADPERDPLTGVFYNEFRLANIGNLPRNRPQILVGSPFSGTFPNIHISRLFEVADVICLTSTEKPFAYFSTMHCNPDTTFLEILTRLPHGFQPDLYWDQQIESMHYIPSGIEKAPFPIVASICHTFNHQTIEHLCQLFDRVLPISQAYGEILQKKYPKKIINLPLGLNWGSFEHILKPNWEKDIDVCLTFSPATAPKYGDKRNQIVELFKQFKMKYGREFVIEIATGLPKEKYFDVLKRSRITVNTTGVNGPYNYRTIEAMCAGSMVFEFEWENHFIGNKFSESFIEGTHGVTFTAESFEEKLLYYLKHPEETEKIAREAYTFQKEEYNYKKLYLQLFDEVKKSHISLPRNFHGFEGALQRDLAYYYQNNQLSSFINYGMMQLYEPKTWIDFNNLMIYSGTVFSKGIGEVFLTLITTKLCREFNGIRIWTLCELFFKSASELAPKEHQWIVKWNFFMLATEMKLSTRKDAEEMLLFLESISPKPFDESNLFFKYYLNSASYPPIQIGDSNLDFQVFNLELLENIDKPKARALLYRDYAIKIIKHMLI